MYILGSSQKKSVPIFCQGHLQDIFFSEKTVLINESALPIIKVYGFSKFDKFPALYQFVHYTNYLNNAEGSQNA